MPFTPKKLAERVERVDFTFGGEPVFIEYRPAVLTGDGLAQFNAIQARAQVAASEEEADATLKEFGAWVSRVLSAWDYLEDPDEDGKPGPMVPLTPERVEREAKRYGDFVAACARVAMEHFTQGKAIGAASSAR